MSKVTKWVVVGGKPQNLKIIVDGKAKEQLLSKDDEPFVPVVDAAFTRARNAGYVQRMKVPADTKVGSADEGAKKAKTKPDPKKETATKSKEPVDSDSKKKNDKVEDGDDLDRLDLDEQIKNVLREEGVNSVEMLSLLDDKELAGINRLGKVRQDLIKQALAKLNKAD